MSTSTNSQGGASNSNSNNNSNGSPLLRSPRRVKRDSASQKHCSNSCDDLMQDLRLQLSMPNAPSLLDQAEEPLHRSAVITILVDEEEEEEEDADVKLSGSNQDGASDPRAAALQILVQNTKANSRRQNSLSAVNKTQFNQEQLRQRQHDQTNRLSAPLITTSPKTNPTSNSSGASVVSNQSTKSTRSLLSRFSRKPTNINSKQSEDWDDGTTASVSSTKSWWRKRNEKKQKNRTDLETKEKKNIVFRSFRIQRKRNNGRSANQQLVADFFDVQSLTSEPDFVGSKMVQHARLGSTNGPLSPGNNDGRRRILETRSVSSHRSQNSRTNAFASFLLRLRQKDKDLGECDDYDDDASQGTNLVGNHIEAHAENEYDYDEEITLGSGFENMSLADSLDDSSVCSETTFHSKLEAGVAEAVAAQQNAMQKLSNQETIQQRSPSLQAQSVSKPPSFLQRMLNKSSSPNDDIIRKVIGAASPVPPPQPAALSHLNEGDDKSNNNLSLNSTISETDSDDSPVEEGSLGQHDEFDYKGGDDHLATGDDSDSVMLQKQGQNSPTAATTAPVGRGKSLMLGNMMTKAKSEHCLEIAQNVSNTHEFHPQQIECPTKDLLNRKFNDTDDSEDNDNDNATKTTSESTTGISCRWDSDASVASDTSLPKRPQRRTTGQFSGSDSDESDSEKSQTKALQQERRDQQRQTREQGTPQECQTPPVPSKNSGHNSPRPQPKPAASQSMRNLKPSDEVDDESILSLLAGLLATWALEREVAAAEEGIVMDEDFDNHTVQVGIINDSGLKGILKTSAASSRSSILSYLEEEKDSRLDLSVTFDYVEIREYERVVGDNPSCTRGPPVAIGWIYQTARLCPVDDYEAIVRGPRRTKRDFHLTAEQRTQILVQEWQCSEEDIRRARREATYIQYCRAKTSFSGSRVAAKEAAFLRKANERSKMQAQHHQAICMISGSMPMDMVAPPTTIPYSPTKSKKMHPRPATSSSPLSRVDRRNTRSTGGTTPHANYVSTSPERRVQPAVSSPLRPRRNGSSNLTSGGTFVKAHTISPSSTPKAPSLSKSHAPSSSPPSSSMTPAPPEVPPSRTLLEV